jgi:hypothetical protein
MKPIKNNSWMKLFILLTVTLVTCGFIIPVHVSAADPGHGAAAIASGTFESNDYYFPANLSVAGNFTVDTNILLVDSTQDRVGIGTATPSIRLSISDASDQLGIIDSDGSQEWRLSANSNLFYIEDENSGAIPFKIEDGANTDTLLIDDSGRVGIGTGSPGYTLQIHNTSNALNVSDILFVDGDTGNVGIGTSTPATSLHVEVSNLSDYVPLATSKLVVEDSGDHNYIEIASSDDKLTGILFSNESEWGGYVIYGTPRFANPGLRFASGEDEVVRFQTSGGFSFGDSYITTDPGENNMIIEGDVGIGDTTPDAPLNIRKDETSTETNIQQDVTYNAIIIDTDYTASNYMPGIVWNTDDNNDGKPKAGIWVLEDGTGTTLKFGTSNLYTTGITNDALVINSAGNVGIGTTSPGYLLEIHNSSTALNVSDILFVNGDADSVTMAGDLYMSDSIHFNVADSIFFESDKHAITYNDGQGNFNIRIGHVSNASAKEAVTEAGYVSHMEWSQSSGWWQLNFDSTSRSVGDTASWDQILQFTKDGALSTTGSFDAVGTVDAGEFTEDGSTTLSNDISGNSATTTEVDSVTNGYYCRGDASNYVDCDVLGDASATCAASRVCLGGHTHPASQVQNDLSCTDIGTDLTSACVASAADLVCTGCVTNTELQYNTGQALTTSSIVRFSGVNVGGAYGADAGEVVAGLTDAGAYNIQGVDVYASDDCIGADDLAAGQAIYHIGDTDTYILFGTNEITLTSGGTLGFKVTNTQRIYAPKVYSDVVSTRAVYVGSTGWLGTVTSSIHRKENIRRDIDKYSSKIFDLEPLMFDYKDDRGDNQFGMIAEEVEPIMPELISYGYFAPNDTNLTNELSPTDLEDHYYTDQGTDEEIFVSGVKDAVIRPVTVQYDKLTPLMLNELKKLKESNDQLVKEVEELKSMLKVDQGSVTVQLG